MTLRITIVLFSLTIIVACSDTDHTVKRLEEAKGSQETEKNTLFIVIDKAGNIKLDGKSVILDSLKQELTDKRRLLDGSPMIIIQGDKSNATHEQIVQIMDIARQVDIVDQVIATE